VEWMRVRLEGGSDDPVAAKGGVKNMMAAKSFSTVHSVEECLSWLRVLATELVPRMQHELTASRRRPANLVLHYTHVQPGSHDRRRALTKRSISTPLPRTSDGGLPSVESLVSTGASLLRGRPGVFPLCHLALVAASFFPVASAAEDISRFLSPADRAQGRAHNTIAPSQVGQREAESQRDGQQVAQREAETEVAAQVGAAQGEIPPEIQPTTSRCETCGSNVLNEDMQEHADMHFAQQIQAAWRAEQGATASVHPPVKRSLVAPKQNKQKKSRATDSKQRTVASMFRPNG